MTKQGWIKMIIKSMALEDCNPNITPSLKGAPEMDTRNGHRWYSYHDTPQEARIRSLPEVTSDHLCRFPAHKNDPIPRHYNVPNLFQDKHIRDVCNPSTITIIGQGFLQKSRINLGTCERFDSYPTSPVVWFTHRHKYSDPLLIRRTSFRTPYIVLSIVLYKRL